MMEIVYELQNDDELIRGMQETSRRGDGIAADPALVASEEWWHGVDSGDIPLQVLEGVIVSATIEGHGDFPQFTMRLHDGTEFTDGRYGDPGQYVPGRAIRVECVEMKWQNMPPESLPFVGATRRVVLRVWIDNS